MPRGWELRSQPLVHIGLHKGVQGQAADLARVALGSLLLCYIYIFSTIRVVVSEALLAPPEDSAGVSIAVR